MTAARRRRTPSEKADKKTLRAAMVRAEREEVEKTLKQAGGNVTRAADKLGILRTSLYRIMKRHSIAPPTGRRPGRQLNPETTGE